MVRFVRGRRTAPTIVAGLASGRTSGPVPLAVFFDAISTTSTRVSDVWRNIVYTFDYGDGSSGTWSISGLSKNTDVGGPLGAHVYDTPGVYTVTVSANDGTSVSTKTLTVTAYNADTYWSSSSQDGAGFTTVCVETGAVTGTGGPAGCTYVSAIPASLASKTRYLLKNGCTHGVVNIPQQRTDVMVGTYGAGAKAIVTSGTSAIGVNIQAGRPGTANWNTRITVQGLDIKKGFGQGSTITDMLVYQCDLNSYLDTVNYEFSVASLVNYWAGTDVGPSGDSGRVVATNLFKVPKRIFIVECTSRGSVTNGPGGVCNIFAEPLAESAFLGNDLQRTTEHNFRLVQGYKCIFRHSAHRGQSSDGIRHPFKICGGGLAEYTGEVAGFIRGDVSEWATRYIIVQSNLVGDALDNNSWMIAVRPQNTLESTTEGIEDVIIEGNVVIKGVGGSFVDLNMMGKRVTYLGNTRQDASTPFNSVATSGYSSLLAAWYGPYYTSR